MVSFNFGIFFKRCFSYFTFYKNVIDDRVIDAENASCKLTGFNLGAPCFLLEKTCVLLEYCTSFNETCPTCVVSKDISISLCFSKLNTNQNWPKFSSKPQFLMKKCHDIEMGTLFSIFSRVSFSPSSTQNMKCHFQMWLAF